MEQSWLSLVGLCIWTLICGWVTEWWSSCWERSRAGWTPGIQVHSWFFVHFCLCNLIIFVQLLDTQVVYETAFALFVILSLLTASQTLRLLFALSHVDLCGWCGSRSKDRSRRRSRSPDPRHGQEAERERERYRQKNREWGDDGREKDRYRDRDRSRDWKREGERDRERERDRDGRKDREWHRDRMRGQDRERDGDRISGRSAR